MVRRAVRWLVPVGIAAAVVGATLVSPASAGTALPERTPQQLLTDVQGATATAVQGTVQVQADLGLPSLPDVAGGPAAHRTDLLSALSGTTTMRVWASPAGARVAVQGTLGETDVVTDGDQVWVWSAADRSVTHLTRPAGDPVTHGAGSDPRAALADLAPARLSAAILAALDPSTAVTSGPDTTVAGRPAYQLVLTPRDAGTLIGSVTIAIDAAERVPTRVTITSTRTGKAALTAGFTDVSFTAPDPAMFRFTPPAGATVTTPDQPGAQSDRPGAPTVRAVGQGWVSVLVLSGLPSAASAPSGDLTGLASWVDTLPRTSGPWGSGRVLSSNLLSALLTDDGRVLVGAVDVATLEAAAG
ncbi:hypothetical protein Q6348_07020 [Isoptericola sp. b441]|uniref:MucB/RseB N-terminal domain-containing protein n=1 Tax=Actinotalea lenta TaxID=3064654 RepID=A0ABT9DDA6_9CELL|nr:MULTISPECIES: hypothetical protein [unclassified Isoptericola]MDO8106947.1 hypothetical protein [Isoptericola sp. b441]MDO8121343.1 hypothetical protein [Isoptericola sp. b490]